MEKYYSGTKYLLLLMIFGFTMVNAQTKLVNLASLAWGGTATATTAASTGPPYGAIMAIDGMIGQYHSWLSNDGVALPQSITINLTKARTLSTIKIFQSAWYNSMYHSKDFRIDGSADGTTYTTITSGTLPNVTDAEWSFPLNNVSLKSVKIVILSGYITPQICGLGEVELWGSVPEAEEPVYSYISPIIRWNSLRGMFNLNLTLSPAAGAFWIGEENKTEGYPSGIYTNGVYKLVISQLALSDKSKVINWTINRPDGQSFTLSNYNVECRTSYSGVYKIFNPNTMFQQSYAVDLPFRINNDVTGQIGQPVVWMQQTDGKNTLTFGFLDQKPLTNIEGSTYDSHNGGEAPGIANSYVRVKMTRPIGTTTPTVKSFTEGIYVNGDSEKTWFEALEGYSVAVDTMRNFVAQAPSAYGFNLLWHSWYAHEDEIDETMIRDDAQRALALGAKTIEIDAGWNMEIGQKYNFDNEGDYVFKSRFPTGADMIKDIHAQGQRVILHVAPLLMGKNSQNYATMKNNNVVSVDGSVQPHMDPRRKVVQDFLLTQWENMIVNYDIDGLWYDFLELPGMAQPVPAGVEIISTDIHEAFAILMKKLYDKARLLKPDIMIINRRNSSNLLSKTYCTHAWPNDSPQDYNVNRRDVVYMKTFGKGIITHAGCSSWAISETDVNVARQMASLTLAGVPAFSVKLAESPASHNAIIKAWADFYEPNKYDIVLGRTVPLLPTPPSAAIRIESNKKAFFGLYEAVPGLLELTKSVDTVYIINAFNKRTATRLEGLAQGKWDVKFYDQAWKFISGKNVIADLTGGIDLNLTGATDCNSVVITKNLTADEFFTNDKKQKVKIYPNPSANEFYIQTDELDSKFKLYDLLGNTILSENNLSSTNQRIGSSLTKGVYLLDIIDVNGNKQQFKLIKN